VVDAKTKSEIIEEIADLYEVIDSILENEKIDKADLLNVQKTKRELR
jgi:predicted house-cleaning noncanonical NTP pyrophosphatase (MazG superfamily)